MGLMAFDGFFVLFEFD